jgi:hypothetical protein
MFVPKGKPSIIAHGFRLDPYQPPEIYLANKKYACQIKIADYVSAENAKTGKGIACLPRSLIT